MRIFGKTLKEYIYPIRFYAAVSVLAVIVQYYGPIDQYPVLLNLTQAAWALMVALSVYTLVKYHNFGFKNILFIGAFYSFLIHGLKAFFFRVFLFPYRIPAEEVPLKLLDRFFYGSFLVMAIAVILGAVFVFSKKKKLL